VAGNKIVLVRDWKTEGDRIKGAFAIARDLAEKIVRPDAPPKPVKEPPPPPPKPVAKPAPAPFRPVPKPAKRTLPRFDKR
jgi:transcription-repair coupling factor (superfamily II helicase)